MAIDAGTHGPPETPSSAEWRGDFRAAEERSLDASLAATPSQRLAWLEQALAFAFKVGALRG
ncbi:MAG TPA: hypothetical protein VNM92_10945 [Thermoanaerobaculia bacterium]|nr:hypothetical protein [Thermoanaerobaculia bacterium]